MHIFIPHLLSLSPFAHYRALFFPPRRRHPKLPAWSASLRFAPRKSASANSANKAKPRPNAAFVSAFSSSSTGGSGASISREDVAVSSSSSPSPLVVASSSNSSTSSVGGGGWNRVSQTSTNVNPSLPSSSSQTGGISASSSGSSSVAIAVAGGLGQESVTSIAPGPVLAPPPTTLPPEVIEKDRAMARAAAEARGEGKKDRIQDFDDQDEDEDINGFWGSDAAKKPRKKKNKRRRAGSPPPGPNMDADYDPRVPNDFVAYKELVKQRKLAEKVYRQSKLEEEDELRNGGYGKERGGNMFSRGNRRDEWEDEGGSESDEEAKEDRRRKLRRFAPPSFYSEPKRKTPERDNRDSQVSASASPPSQVPGTAPSPPSQAMTGEEAYARRVALTAATSGEEAYARRLAMSQRSSRPWQPEPPVASKDAPAPLNQLAKDQGGATQSSPDSAAPGPPPPPGAPPQAPTMDFAARQSAAAAIAARLAKVAAGNQASSATVPAQAVSQSKEEGNDKNDDDDNDSEGHRPDPAGFAARLMAKYGYKKGEGIGAEGNKGILQPLTAEKSSSSPSGSHAGGGRKGGGWNLASQARGHIVNANADEKAVADKNRFGDPSEVVLLENMVDENDLDDDLPGEIGEECSKHGIVQRVFIYPGTSSGVRIFVRFSGMAGSWRAVRELDERYFGGRKVRARYYPLVKFEGGDYHF
ncbi:hypothetical protein IE53DRAFT_346291 [Violaceomyces palustris]|uniref:Uncharacterized protein n=1 Tax=Violaceomyces palustris TaxID=1673888 RepID=A0ACD0NTM2_9BASI|nr:hypothetical protein IE53DRAFT_346291 [Violaceomyces palustris]